MKNLSENKPIRKELLSMIAPASFGMLLTFLFQLVDTYFIGKLGTNELAAIGFSYPVYLLIVSLFMGLASGISAAVGKAIGEKNLNKAKFLTTISQFSFMIVTVVIGTLGYFSISFVFQMLGADHNAIILISDYMEIIYIGMFALVGTLIGNAALMAKGVMVKSTIIMAIGGVCNLALDYLLIFGIGPFPIMELQGAALATVISWGVTFILMTILLHKENLWSIYELLLFSQMKSALSEILKIGMPAVVAQILNPVAITVITALVANYGEKAVAAYGIAVRIESLGLTGILALSVIMTPLVAQNYGAKLKERLDQIIIYAGKLNVYWSIAFYILLIAFSTSITSIFSNDPVVINHTANYFYIVGISFMAYGLTLSTTSFFNGVYQPNTSLRLTLIKSLVLTIPFAFLGSWINIESIWIGITLANFAGLIVADKALKKWKLENQSELIGINRILAYKDDFKILAKIAKR
ncbi:MATE family efflux transporter [Aureibacter tunicatorum]|uniref:Multidrug-efflux transporter n=1 Tax=Aureibacter tunicatorum TaxID=866807 RepID=A0AAE4BS23_9BACT|nr:MATE family efflux transporter [Aureibacter tunicatorum]MDR6239306.1 putative MATE family efflux protein [Aureibacter tunicatorum]BDD04770.1 MATE family efflux transporter [Aureibacter tunicatorum]